MKKLYLLTLLALGQSAVYAQPYLSIFGDASTSWNILKNIPHGKLTDSLYTGIDSSFNGHNYTSVYSYKDLVGLIREDTAVGKVWYYSTDNQKENLVMNLSLAVGDTFFLDSGPWSSDSIAIVDSVYADALGKKHIRLDYMLNYDKNEKVPLTFIEGLGPNAGIIYQCHDKYFGTLNFVYNYYLLCSYKNGTSYYVNTAFKGTEYDGFCRIDVIIGMEETNQAPPWKLYPNPFYDYTVLSFENKQALNCTLEIYNLQGQIVQSKQNITTEEIRIEKDNLGNGTYFFRLYSDSKVIAGGKMLVGM